MLIIKHSTRKFLDRCLNSSTITTWLSYFAKTGSLVFVLPLILYQFPTEEVALWYLFAIIISFGAIADFGFRSTFIRIISFIYGGAQKIELYNKENKADETSEINWALFENLVSLMRKIYTGIGLVFSLLLISIGTIALNKPINEVNNIFDAWLAWSIICIIAVIEFQGKIYKNYLEGLFKVALVKRVETLFRVGSIVTSLLVLTFAPTLLNLVIANRIWSIFNVLRDRYLARKVNDEVFKSFKPQPFSKELFSDIWKPAWRSGLSGVMSNGLTQLTGVLYAQVGISASLASYLMGLKIINEIRNFSNASFYSKIPVLAKLRAKGDIKQLIQVARKNINIAYTIFFLSVLGIGLFSDRLIEFIGSETAFVSADLWWLLGIAFLIHRIGGFQMQIYVSTNHIISHWVDGISGIIFLTTTFLLLDSFGVYAFVYAMILSYGTIYFFVSSFYSFKSLNLTTKQFIGYFFMLPLVFLLIFTVCYYLSINV